MESSVGKSTEVIVKVYGRLVSEEDFNNLIIKQVDGQMVRFSDIGEAVLGPENEEISIKLNGTDGISLALIPFRELIILKLQMNSISGMKILKRIFPMD